MARNVPTRLTDEDLSSVYGGQKIYYALDPENNQTCYFVPDEIGVFVTYNETAAIKNSPLKVGSKFKECKDLEDAEKRAWRWIDKFHLLAKKSDSK